MQEQLPDEHHPCIPKLSQVTIYYLGKHIFLTLLNSQLINKEWWVVSVTKWHLWQTMAILAIPHQAI